MVRSMTYSAIVRSFATILITIALDLTMALVESSPLSIIVSYLFQVPARNFLNLFPDDFLNSFELLLSIFLKLRIQRHSKFPTCMMNIFPTFRI